MAREVAALPLQPLISIVTPVYNTDPRWLRACIDSVRRQVYPQLGALPVRRRVDDAARRSRRCVSTRATRGSASATSSVNAGISAASNAALAMARGEFVALLDHDDELTPDALAEVVRHLNAQPGRRRDLFRRRQARPAGSALRSVLQARLVARPLPDRACIPATSW